MSSSLIPAPHPGDAKKPTAALPVKLANTLKAVDVRKRGFDPFVIGVVVGAMATLLGVLLGLSFFLLT